VTNTSSAELQKAVQHRILNREGGAFSTCFKLKFKQRLIQSIQDQQRWYMMVLVWPIPLTKIVILSERKGSSNSLKWLSANLRKNLQQMCSVKPNRENPSMADPREKPSPSKLWPAAFRSLDGNVTSPNDQRKDRRKVVVSANQPRKGCETCVPKQTMASSLSLVA